MKLTKIESYEIQAFAFRVMTGYVAPGKDASPLADEAPYEERCAAFDEWRNEHAPCILAMLHGFEALIDRDDEPTRALLDRLDAAEAENERLRAELAEVPAKLKKAFQLGQQYWDQADSESYKKNKKAGQTYAEFQSLLDAALAAKEE